MRKMIGEAIAKAPPTFIRKLQTADVSVDCSLGLLKLVRGFRNLEPWALKLFDASGKYPTGMFQGSRADMGAFDECLETAVLDGSGRVTSRGQYCNLMFYIKNATAWQKKMEPVLQVMHPSMYQFKNYFFLEELPIVRLGICVLDDCSQRDLQAIVDAVKPSIVDIEVSTCTTIEPEPWNATQKSIVILLGFLVIIVVGSTTIDLFMQSTRKLAGKHSALIAVVTAFSAAANTRALLKVADRADADHYQLQFLHGLRFFSLAYIVMGHSYQTMSDTWSRLQNLLSGVSHWPNMMIAAGFGSVDTFFFLR
ncbi:nose resistant to fluoxetine protein 6-like [Rhipicephalus sanguineus]|uniref:nose resistant to fluoxetine protein 6-like n=1 Tax=Rhipicephalus sanguineus TaxID=34632 RepID=UPI0020C461A6|nr:nose resistant to fluoxetine protein 6-like [Rhipicephalus sanguineus]